MSFCFWFEQWKREPKSPETNVNIYHSSDWWADESAFLEALDYVKFQCIYVYAIKTDKNWSFQYAYNISDHLLRLASL